MCAEENLASTKVTPETIQEATSTAIAAEYILHQHGFLVSVRKVKSQEKCESILFEHQADSLCIRQPSQRETR
jgi:hypothetical protein